MTTLSIDSSVKVTHASTRTKLWERHNIKRNETAPLSIPASYTHLKINRLASTMKTGTKNQTRLLPAGSKTFFPLTVHQINSVWLNAAEKMLGQKCVVTPVLMPNSHWWHLYYWYNFCLSVWTAAYADFVGFTLVNVTITKNHKWTLYYTVKR